MDNDDNERQLALIELSLPTDTADKQLTTVFSILNAPF